MDERNTKMVAIGMIKGTRSRPRVESLDFDFQWQ